MEGLNLDNILDEAEIGLFNDTGKQEDTPPANEPSDEGTKESKNNEEINTAEVDPNSLFGEGESESVGSEEQNNEEKEDPDSDKGKGTSPNTDFFSSIAEALTEEGVLPNLNEETIKNIKTPEDLRKAIDEHIKSNLNEQQQRVIDALNNNVEPDAIRQYEGVLGYLDSIKEEDLKSEGEQFENLRSRLIYQDFINRGFDKARAEREVKKALDNGTDIEDAIEALNSNKSFYKDSYNKLLEDAKTAQEEEENKRKARATKLKDSIFDDNQKFFGEITLDNATKQKVFDSISKPIYKDPKTGEFYTAVQKFESEHSDEFLAKLGLIFTLTDGFKNLDGLVKGKVKKEVKRGLRDLEGKINNTSRDSYGNLRFSSGVDDKESYLGKGIRLAL